MSTLDDLVLEAQRELSVCNACRYCEGYCAVFPAIERRTEFGGGDVLFLANLCHDCRACFQACMYTVPHEFAIDIPSLMSAVRAETYPRFARPRPMAWAFRHSFGAAAAMAAVGAVLVLLVMLGFGTLQGLFRVHSGPGAFYTVVPWLAMLVPALGASALVAAALWSGLAGFWRETHGSLRALADLRAWAGASSDVLRMRYLDGGGPGCYYPDAGKHAPWRRICHQLVLFGFLADFASTAVAAFDQDVLGLQPPFPLLSVPVVLGTGGGLALVAGCTGLLWLKARSTRSLASPSMLALDSSFLAVLDLVAVSGLLLLALRATSLLGSLLTLHLALLVALYFTFPYGKFVHAVYRYLALVKHRVEGAAASTGRG